MADTAQANAVAGDVNFVDQNGDGVINNEDKVVIGNPHPDFTYGFTAGAKYKNFDFNLFLQGSHETTLPRNVPVRPQHHQLAHRGIGSMDREVQPTKPHESRMRT